MYTAQEMVRALISKGYTQTKIADDSGVTQPTVSRAYHGRGVTYENGKKIETLYVQVFTPSQLVAAPPRRRSTDAPL